MSPVLCFIIKYFEDGLSLYPFPHPREVATHLVSMLGSKIISIFLSAPEKPCEPHTTHVSVLREGVVSQEVGHLSQNCGSSTALIYPIEMGVDPR